MNFFAYLFRLHAMMSPGLPERGKREDFMRGSCGRSFVVDSRGVL